MNNLPIVYQQKYMINLTQQLRYERELKQYYRILAYLSIAWALALSGILAVDYFLQTPML